MGKKRILYIPNLSYLANPVFFSVIKHLPDFQNIYFDADYYKEYENSANRLANDQQAMQLFDEYYRIDKNDKINFKSENEEINFIKNKIEGLKPDAFVTISDKTFVYKICTAYFPDIPIFVIQTCAIKNSFPGISFKQKLASLIKNNSFRLKNNIPFAEDTISYKLIWSKFWVRDKSVYDENKFFETGNPGYDALFLNPLQKHENLKKQFGIDEDKKVILITLTKKRTIGEEKFNKFLDIYSEVIKKNENIFFIIKPHPLENPEYLNKKFNVNEAKNLKIIFEEKLENLFKISDLLISSWSVTVYEALINNIPAIVLNPQNEFDIKTFTPDAENIDIAADDKSLNALIHQSLFNLNYSKFTERKNNFLKKVLTIIDGSSGKLASDIIRAKTNEK
ncbi:MAG TPA: CDP-glycerol glycerophosphotransferase family protein [Ignavibacteria bacterium]|nr:CDP-glycerol glycerophosphotransferase family protein [Ignavibacteria bacterium]